MVLVVRFDEVLQDRTRLPDMDLFTVWERGVGDGRHAAVWIDGEEPWLLLDTGGEVEFLDSVWEAELLQGNRDFDPVRGLRGVQSNRGGCCGGRHCARVEKVFGDVEKSGGAVECGEKHGRGSGRGGVLYWGEGGLG